jgi:MFS family permease
MSSLFLLYKYVIQISPSTMTANLMQHFHLTAAGLGNLASFYFYSYLIVQFFAGPILDRFSPRIVSTIAILIMSASAFGFAHANTLDQALLYRAITGIGAAIATVSYLKLASAWFDDHQYSLVAGLLATAVSLGAIIGEAPIAYSVTSIGWQHTLVLCAIIGIIIAAAYFIVVRNKPDVEIATTIQPERITIADFKKVITNPKTWAITLYAGLAWAPIAVLGGLWGNPFLMATYNISNAAAASLMSLAFLGLAFGAPLFGYIATRFNIYCNAMLLGLIITLITLLIIIYNPIHNKTVVAIALFLFGMGTGAFMLSFSLGRIWFGTVLIASVSALINTGSDLIGAITEPIVGKLLDNSWQGKIEHGVRKFSLHNYHTSMIMLPIYLVIAIFILLWLKKQSE